MRAIRKGSRRDPVPANGLKYFSQLINARQEPETYSTPVCYRHVEDIAQSISRRGVTESVLVIVEPGVADPNEIGPNIFCCFLCKLEGS